jgi:hypothetical protein
MRVGPGVEIVADFADETSVGCELEELRSSRGVGGTSGVAARENEDVSFGVDGYAGDFAKVEIGRELQEVGDGVVEDFGWLLSRQRCWQKRGEDKNRDRDLRTSSESPCGRKTPMSVHDLVACDGSADAGPLCEGGLRHDASVE